MPRLVSCGRRARRMQVYTAVYLGAAGPPSNQLEYQAMRELLEQAAVGEAARTTVRVGRGLASRSSSKRRWCCCHMSAMTQKEPKNVVSKVYLGQWGRAGGARRGTRTCHDPLGGTHTR